MPEKATKGKCPRVVSRLKRLAATLRRVGAPPFRFVHHVLESHFKKHSASLTAAGIAFYLGISLAPLILLGVSVAGFLIGSSERAGEVISEAFVTLIPQGGDLIHSLLERVVANRLSVGLIGLVALLWISSRLTNAVRRALDDVYGGLARPRRWWEGRLVSLGMLVGILAFVIGGAWLNGLFAHLATTDWTLWGIELTPLRWLARIILLLTPYALSWLFFFLVYRLVPTTRGGARAAAIGAGVAALGFEGAKLAFSFYLAHLSNQGLYYGILTAVVMLSLWAYYAAHVLLLGAEVSRALEDRRHQQISVNNHSKETHLPSKTTKRSLSSRKSSDSSR